MELFNEKYVHFIWNDELEGKKGFFADDVDDLYNRVKSNFAGYYNTVSGSERIAYPFKMNGVPYRFFYYDPFYEIKKAYIEGKQIQYKFNDEPKWYDINDADMADIESAGLSWFDDDECEYRIKPENHLKWSDLKIGDIVRHKTTKVEHLVTGIHYDHQCIYFGGEWTSDEGLVDWIKVDKE